MPEITKKNASPYWVSECANHKFLLGDAKKQMKTLPSRSVQCIVTSPPYWPLRSYTDSPDEIGKEGQLGHYLNAMISVGEELHRVLRDDGTFWLNIGDSRVGAKPGSQNSLPWRIAFALEKSGWNLRQDIIWSKPNPLPDGSSRNRCTKSHEYVFLFTKALDYFFDIESIRNPSGSLPRSVWEIVPKKEKGIKHRAVMSRELIRKCIAAGTSMKGCCDLCGAPMARVIRKVGGTVGQSYLRDDSFKWSRNGISGSLDGVPKTALTVGWTTGCSCRRVKEEDKLEPCVVLDPFVGSGSVSCVAATMKRRSIGIDLSEEYLKDVAIPRLEKQLG